MRVVLVLWLFLLLSGAVMCKKRRKPHIMFILFDDWGWHDVSWSPYADLYTPYMAQLKEESLELLQFYTQPKCTAARAALMTGRLPYKMGLQTHNVFSRTKNNTLDLSYKLLPEYLKDLGYHNHMVGKWHLGHCTANATPIYRGFRTHFGSWGNTENHFNLTTKGLLDWNWQNEPYWAAQGTYSAHLITNHTQFMLKKHFGNDSTKDEPLFMYVSHLVPHAPAMAPEKYINGPKCRDIPETVPFNATTNVTNLRRIYCGMVAAMDEGIGNITQTLRNLSVIDDFIIIVTSDNGGAINVGASNYPLRGNKQSVYEGGTRVRTLLRAPKFLEENKTTGEYDGLVHMTDWLPTFIRLAKGSPKKLLPKGEIDGRNVWPFIKRGVPTSRRWMVYNIDSARKLGAIRYKNASHDFKLVYSDRNGRELGYRYPDPRPENERGNFTMKERYLTNGRLYYLYDLSVNEEEKMPQDFPDASISNPKIFKRMKKKLANLTEEEVESPTYYPLTKHKKNGAYRVAGC